MLNLLIAIVSETNKQVASKNELIYEKNRVFIIREYFAKEKHKEIMKEFLRSKYLIDVIRKKSIENTNEKSQNNPKSFKEMIDKKLKVLSVK